MREEACSLQTSEVDRRKWSKAQWVGPLVINSPLLPRLPLQVAALCYRLMDTYDDESEFVQKKIRYVHVFQEGNVCEEFRKES